MGENYLKQLNKSDVKSFFIEIGIFDKISLSHFESVKALMNFQALSRKQLLCSDEIVSLLAKCALENEKSLPHRSYWVKMKIE